MDDRDLQNQRVHFPRPFEMHYFRALFEMVWSIMMHSALLPRGKCLIHIGPDGSPDWHGNCTADNTRAEGRAK